MISQFFDPEPTLKGMVFAKGLASRGHTVRVLTGFPNYPSGKLANGYKLAPHSREEIDGIIVDRVWLYPSHDASAVRRGANYASFAASSSVRALVDRWRPDIVWVHHPPLTAVTAALVQRVRKNVPVVLEVQDLWPDSLSETGMINSRRFLGEVGRGMDHTYAKASAIIAISPGFKESITARGVPQEKIHVIPNWADEERLRPSPEDLAWSRDVVNPREFNVAFTGNMGPAQDLEVIIRAAHLASSPMPGLRIHMVGDGLSEGSLRSMVRDLKLTNVSFYGRQSMGRAAALAQASDTGLVHLKRSPLFEVTIPSKTQAYMAMGVPILMAVSGDAATIVTASGGGVVTSPGDPPSLANALKTLRDIGAAARLNMGTSGQEYYSREMSVTVGLGRYDRLFQEVVKHDRKQRVFGT